MARNLDAKCRQCRREGEKLFLKGEKCFTDKCSVERRAYAPGQHGQKSGQRLSGYGTQLREKQKIRRIYGVLERQFRKVFGDAERKKGQTGDRMGFGVSRAEARQLVRHNGVLINGKRVDIPSYSVRPGDVIQLLDSTRGHLRTKAALEAAESRGFPAWIEVDVKEGKGIFKSYPAREDLPPSISEGLVVELYSR